MERLVVIGGGIAGLAAAHAASRRSTGGLQVTVIERESAVGGKARTVRDDGWLVEAGPTGYLDNEPALDGLVEAAGLEKLPADAAAARRFLVRGGRMREIRPHPIHFARAGILGPLGLLRILREPFIRGRGDDGDETVWEFAARRLGKQAADRVIAPMVLGVFAGDARKLSLPAAFPRMRALELEHGSLVRGMISRMRAGRLKGGPAGPGGTLTSFRDGLETLPRALAARGGFEVRCGAAARALERREGRWQVRLEGGDGVSADAVVLAGEPWAMAALLPGDASGLARELESILCPPVVVVALGFGEQALGRVPRGFGVLIPRGEGYRILGCLWDTHIFPGRSPQRRLLLRVMLGGAVDPEVGGWSESRLVETSRSDLNRLLGIDESPVFQHVVSWPRAIPQYELGHRERVERIEAEAGRMPGLFITGNALHGIAFGKAAAHGVVCGERAADWLAGAEGRGEPAAAARADAP